MIRPAHPRARADSLRSLNDEVAVTDVIGALWRHYCRHHLKDVATTDTPPPEIEGGGIQYPPLLDFTKK